MKKNRIFTHSNIVCIAIMTIALPCAAMIEDNVVRPFVFCSVGLLEWSICIICGMMQKHDFSESVMIQLKKAGLSCKKKNDVIEVTQGDLIMNVRFWDNGTRGMKRVHFMFDFAPNIINEVRPEGWALLAAQCNASFEHTMVKFYGDHFSCMVETSVKTAKDLLEEYRFAFDKINETMQGMQVNAGKVANQFRVERKQIGFVVPVTQ